MKIRALVGPGLQLLGGATAVAGALLLFGLGWTLLAVGVVVAGLGVLKEAGLI